MQHFKNEKIILINLVSQYYEQFTARSTVIHAKCAG